MTDLNYQLTPSNAKGSRHQHKEQAPSPRFRWVAKLEQGDRDAMRMTYDAVGFDVVEVVREAMSTKRRRISTHVAQSVAKTIRQNIRGLLEESQGIEIPLDELLWSALSVSLLRYSGNSNYIKYVTGVAENMIEATSPTYVTRLPLQLPEPTTNHAKRNQQARWGDDLQYTPEELFRLNKGLPPGDPYTS